MARHLLFDRKGREISSKEFEEKHSNFEYVVVAKSKLVWNGKNVEVSTVWLGLDHSHTGEGPPVLFETMIFHDLSEDEEEKYDMSGMYQHRWHTVAEALKGHREICSDIEHKLPISHEDTGIIHKFLEMLNLQDDEDETDLV